MLKNLPKAIAYSLFFMLLMAMCAAILVLALIGAGLVGCQTVNRVELIVIRPVPTCDDLNGYRHVPTIDEPTDDPDNAWHTSYFRSFTEDDINKFHHIIRISVGTVKKDCQKMALNITTDTPRGLHFDTHVYIDCTGKIEHDFGFEEELDVMVADPYFKCLPQEVREAVQKLIEYGKTVPNPYTSD